MTIQWSRTTIVSCVTIVIRDNLGGDGLLGLSGLGLSSGDGSALVTAVDWVLSVDLCKPFVVAIILRSTLRAAGATTPSPELVCRCLPRTFSLGVIQVYTIRYV